MFDHDLNNISMCGSGVLIIPFGNQTFWKEEKERFAEGDTVMRISGHG
jgi:hypothetical protein